MRQNFVRRMTQVGSPGARMSHEVAHRHPGSAKVIGDGLTADEARRETPRTMRPITRRDFLKTSGAIAASLFVEIRHLASAQAATAAQEKRWFKGNLHVHNQWSDGQPLPAGVDPPLIHFERASVRGFAGCNRFNATVTESKPGEITIGPPAGTKMACPPEKMELEARFLEQLAKVNRYGYLAEQLALTWQDGERTGTLLFRK